MKLPVLNVPDGTLMMPQKCEGLSGCVTCKLYEKNGGRCGGCTTRHRAQLKDNYKECLTVECGECTGFDVEVQAICCKSPLKDMYMSAVTGDDWNNPNWKYKKRDLIQLKEKALFYITAGSIATMLPQGEYLVPEGTEAACVSLGRIWTGKKFASNDLHDYLRVHKDTKLIMTTMNKDDILESAWTQSMYEDPEKLTRIGLSYWMPIAFSNYHQDARMQQYWSFARTQYVSTRMHPHFTHGSFMLPGLDLKDLYDEAYAAMPQFTFNTQFIEGNVKRFRKALAYLKRIGDMYPDAPFWLVGAMTPSFMHNVRKAVGRTRDVYYVSGNPHHYSTQGKTLTMAGGCYKSKLSKFDLLRSNLATAEKMVKQYG